MIAYIIANINIVIIIKFNIASLINKDDHELMKIIPINKKYLFYVNILFQINLTIVILRCILATDMAKHDSIMSEFTKILAEFDYKNPHHKNMVSFGVFNYIIFLTNYLNVEAMLMVIL